MTQPSFPHLFSPFTVGGLRFENRIFSTGHMTLMVDDGKPSEQLARVSDPDFPEHAVAYTRKVTMVWCATGYWPSNGAGGAAESTAAMADHLCPDYRQLFPLTSFH